MVDRIGRSATFKGRHLYKCQLGGQRAHPRPPSMVIWPVAQLATNKRARAETARMIHRDHEDAPSVACAPVRAQRGAAQCHRSDVCI